VYASPLPAWKLSPAPQMSTGLATALVGTKVSPPSSTNNGEARRKISHFQKIVAPQDRLPVHSDMRFFLGHRTWCNEDVARIQSLRDRLIFLDLQCQRSTKRGFSLEQGDAIAAEKVLQA
jgi:hypothetical protein